MVVVMLGYIYFFKIKSFKLYKDLGKLFFCYYINGYKQI